MRFPVFPQYPTPVSFGDYGSYTLSSNTYECPAHLQLSSLPIEITADGGIWEPPVASPPVENNLNQTIEGKAGWIVPDPAPFLNTTENAWVQATPVQQPNTLIDKLLMVVDAKREITNALNKPEPGRIEKMLENGDT